MIKLFNIFLILFLWIFKACRLFAVPAMGYNSYLGISKESAWGTPTAAADWIAFNSDTLKWEKPRRPRHGARDLTYTSHYPGKLMTSGGVNTDIWFEGMLLLWRMLLGGYAYTNLDTGVEQHAFTIAKTLPAGLTLRKGLDKHEQIFEGSKINKATFDFAIDEPAKLTFDIIGETISTGSVGSPTFPSDTLVIDHSQVVVKYDTTEKEVQGAQLVFDNALSSDRRKLGSEGILEPMRTGPVICSGVVNMEFTATADYDLFEAATEKVIEILCEGAVISGAYKYTLKLYCARAVFDDVSFNVDGQGPVKMPMNFKTFYDSGTSKDVFELTCINTESDMGAW